MRRKPEIDIDAPGKELQRVEGHVELDSVTFAYPSRPGGVRAVLPALPPGVVGLARAAAAAAGPLLAAACCGDGGAGEPAGLLPAGLGSVWPRPMTPTAIGRAPPGRAADPGVSGSATHPG